MGFLPVAVMVALNAAAAVMVTLVKLAMDEGLDPLVLVTLQQLTAALFLGPIALIREGKSRPRLTLAVAAHLFASAALGAALRQYMIFLALRYTTATFVAAFSNVAPVLTFLLAAATRSETLRPRTGPGAAKLAGALLSLAGAMLLTLYRGPPLTHLDHAHAHQHSAAFAAAASPTSPPSLSPAEASRRWTLGTAAILGNCVCLSCWFLLHGRLARKYPYVYSCNAFVSAFSFLQVAAVGLCARRSLDAWLLTSRLQILTVLYAGIVACGVSFVLLTWCIERRGPVFVAAFVPVVQIIVSVIDFALLHEPLYLGSVLGSVLVIGGLYLLLWGKRQEEALQQEPPKVAEHDTEQPPQQQQVQTQP